MSVCIPTTQFRIAIAALLGVLVGCSPVYEAGKQFNFPKQKDATLFAVGNVIETTITNRSGNAIGGLVLQDASLIQNADELAASKRQHFVLFRDFLLGNMLSGAYWQQQSEKQKGLGLPVIDTRSSEAIIVTVDSNRIVTQRKSVRVAHTRIGVDTNDFTRSFTP